MILGIVSIPAVAAFGSGGLIGLVAVTLGGFGFRDARGGRGWMAITGVVLGAIAVLVILGYLVALLTDDKPGLRS